MIKHATATVYTLHRDDYGRWRAGLIRHPLWNRWMPAGGHVESRENAAEAALREAAEETGLSGLRLVNPHAPAVAPGFPAIGHQDYAGHVPLPWWVVEFAIPKDRSLGEPHVHVDHQFVAVCAESRPATEPELPFAWYEAGELAGIAVFDNVAATVRHLLEHAEELVTGPSRSVRVLSE